MAPLVCNGPDGSSLLGFLSSVGAFSALSRAWPKRNVRMQWIKDGGWHPAFQADRDLTRDRVIAAIWRELRKRQINLLEADGEPAKNTDKFTRPLFRSQAERIAQHASVHDRSDADFLAAMVGEVELGRPRGPSNEVYLADTALRTQNGGAHQNFLGTMRNLLEKVTREEIADTLFKAWRLKEVKDLLSLRYDSAEDRRYALRATNPAQAPIVTFPGANRLAIEAFECFPTFPGRKLLTTGFPGNGLNIVWPIWNASIPIETLRSLMLMKDLYRPEKSENLTTTGIVATFTSTRISTGLNNALRNFTPARRI